MNTAVPVGPRCEASINIAGSVHQCKLNTGSGHWSDKDGPMPHEVEILAADGNSATVIRWSTWRKVQPCASGGGNYDLSGHWRI